MNVTKIKFLLTLKTSSLIKKESITTLYHKNTYNLIHILYKEGLIQSFELHNSIKKTSLSVYLRYYYDKILLNSIEIVSKPSLNKYLSLRDIYRLNYKKKLYFFSTSRGLKTLLECKINKLGGKLLFSC